MKKRIIVLIIGVICITNLYGREIENRDVENILAPIVDLIIENDLENKNIAVGKVNDDNGKISLLSNVIADNIENLLVEKGKNKKINVIERENISKLLEEQQLTLFGVVSEDKAAKVGKIAGVNLFCFIKYRIIKEKTTLFIKLTDCETGEIISSLTKTIQFPYEIMQLAEKYNELMLEEDMILVKGGIFDMGWDEKISPKTNLFNGEDNVPVHKVKLSDFYIGKYEITYSKFEKFVNDKKYLTEFEKKNIENGNEDYPIYKNINSEEQPVVCVTHTDIVRYCNWLSKKNGYKPAYEEKSEELIDENGEKTTDLKKVKGYRLPTEAEWEYAATGGEKSNYYEYSGSDTFEDVGWFWKVSNPQMVGLKMPNELGIYDMTGNAQEMCEDYYDKDYYARSDYENPCNFKKNGLNNRTFRGGSIGGNYEKCLGRQLYMINEYSGFRIVRTKEEVK